MTTDALITLERLSRTRDTDSSRNPEPYIWPVLLWTHDKVLASRELVGVTTPEGTNAREVIKKGMRIGESADIPRSVGLLCTRFDSGSRIRRLVLAVAVLEKDEAPEAAIRAGFQAFSSALRAAVADNLLALVTADQMADDNERNAEINAIIGKIKPLVTKRVRCAMEKSLTGWQKTRAVAGTLNFDNFIGSDFMNFPDLFATSINLSFGTGNADRYKIQGRLELRPVHAGPSKNPVNVPKTGQS